MKKQTFLWKEHLRPGDLVIDATLGNGHDTYTLAQILQGEGKIIAYDIQEKAFQEAKKTLSSLTAKERSIISLKHASHAHFTEKNVSLIVYNLGYLPGGDKSITTRAETTLQSLQSALLALAEGGMISLTCYSGHSEGEREKNLVQSYLLQLPKSLAVYQIELINRRAAPSCFLIIK